MRDELNVKSLRFVSEADELGRFELKPNYRTLGPRFGKQMPQVAAAVAALDPTALRQGREVGLNIDGHEHQIGPEDVQLVLQPLDGYQVERSGTHAVALDLELDDELRREALAREIVHAVQAARKGAGLQVEDRIALTLGRRRRAARGGPRSRGLRDPRDAGGRAGLRRRGRRPRAPRSRGWSWWWASSGGRLARPMQLPPAFDERPFALQLVGLVVVPVIFGLLTGFALGWSEVRLPDHGRPDRAPRRVPGRDRAPRLRGRLRPRARGRARVRQLHPARPQDRRHRGQGRAGRSRRWCSWSSPPSSVACSAASAAASARAARALSPRPRRSRRVGRALPAQALTALATLGAIAAAAPAAASAAYTRHLDVSYDIDSPPAAPALNRARRLFAAGSPARLASRGGVRARRRLAAGRQAHRDPAKGGAVHRRRVRARQRELPALAASRRPRARSTPSAQVPGLTRTTWARRSAWLHRHVARYGGDPTRIVLIGHSSGAHMASLVEWHPRYVRAYGGARAPGSSAWCRSTRRPTTSTGLAVDPLRNEGARGVWSVFGTPEENAAGGLWAAGLAAAPGGRERSAVPAR